MKRRTEALMAWLIVALFATAIGRAQTTDSTQGLKPTPAADTSASSDADIDSQIETLRADARADRVAIITAAMKFTPAESTAFWPIYRKYAEDLARLNDSRVQLIKDYADKFETLTDADAKTLANQAFDYESKRTDLKKRYFTEFNRELSAKTTAKFFQLENRLDLITDLMIASELPPLLDSPATGNSSQGPQ